MSYPLLRKKLFLLKLYQIHDKKNIDINYQNNGISESALHEAAKRGFLEIAEILLASGAQKNIKFQNKTPLHYASKESQLSIVKLLVYNDALINIDL